MTFYIDQAQNYFNATVNLKTGIFQEKMLQKLKPKASILDIGCGSGRDSAYFKANTLNVTAFDGSSKLVELANQHFNIKARSCLYDSFTSEIQYDAFWAMASLVHLRVDSFVKTVKHLSMFLKKNGVFYLSLKPESEHGFDENKGLFFQGWSENLFKDVFMKEFSDIFAANFEVELTEDAGGRPFKWLNIWLMKK